MKIRMTSTDYDKLIFAGLEYDLPADEALKLIEDQKAIALEEDEKPVKKTARKKEGDE